MFDVEGAQVAVQHQFPVSPRKLPLRDCQLVPVRSALMPAAFVMYTADHEATALGRAVVEVVTINIMLLALLAKTRTVASWM